MNVVSALVKLFVLFTSQLITNFISQYINRHNPELKKKKNHQLTKRAHEIKLPWRCYRRRESAAAARGRRPHPYAVSALTEAQAAEEETLEREAL